MSLRVARWGIGVVLGMVALLILNCLYLGYLDQTHRLFVVTDFSHHGWLSGRVVLGGGDPYDAQGWLRAHWTAEYDREIGWEYASGQFVNAYQTRAGAVYNPGHVSDFLYPLWMAFLFAPFALLPLFWALALFMLVSEVAIMVALWCACRILNFHPPWYVAVLILLLAFGFRPTFFTLQEGAYSGLVFAALLGAVLLIERRSAPWLVGALLAFATIKLQISVAILAFIGLWLLRQRRWTALGWAAGWSLLTWGLPTLLAPGWIGEWLAMTRLVSPTIFAQPTLWSLWVAVAGPLWWVLGVGVTTILVLWLWRLWRRDLTLGTWHTLPFTFILSLLLPIYAWDYDMILLLLPWLACWSRVALGTSVAPRLWRYVLMIWILFLPLYALLPMEPRTQAGYGVLLPITLLIIYLLMARDPAFAEIRLLPLALHRAE